MNEDINKIIGYIRRRPWRLIAVAPWTLQLAIFYIIVMTVVDGFQSGLRFGFGDAFIPLVIVFVLAILALSFRKMRIGIGILVLILVALCMFSKNEHGFSFNDLGVGFSLLLIGALLLCKRSRQWNPNLTMIDGNMSEVSALKCAANSVWQVLVARKWLLGLVALGFILYVVGLITTMANNGSDNGGGSRRMTAQNKYVKDGYIEFDTSYSDLRKSFWGLPWDSEPPTGCTVPCDIEYEVKNPPFTKAVFSYDENGLAHVSLSGRQNWDKGKCFLEFMKIRSFYAIKSHTPIKYSDEPVEGKYLGVGSGDMTVIVRVDILGKDNREVVVGLSRPHAFK